MKNDANHTSPISENWRRGIFTGLFPEGSITLISRPEKGITKKGIVTNIPHEHGNKYHWQNTNKNSNMWK